MNDATRGSRAVPLRPPAPAPWALLALLGACAPAHSPPSAAPPASAVAAAPSASTPAEPSAQQSPSERGGPAATASPSTGCALGAGAEPGEGIIRAGGRESPYLVTLPKSYDGKQPMPLVFAFHGRGRSHLTMREADAQGFHEAVGSRAIVAYLKSVGAGWDKSSVAPFEALYDRVLSSFCVDTERVFAAGHSSGAHFAHRLACTHSERLRGIAAIAGGLEQPVCAGRTAALLVHGRRDAVVSVSRGRRALERVLRRNGCSASTDPFGMEGCHRHRGCDPGLPVVWCDHEEPTYQNTNHGWPSFASAAVASFFSSLEPEPWPAGDNLLASTSSEAWEGNFARSDLGHVERPAGALCANLVEAGENPWDVQLAHHDLTMKGGGQRYRVDLRVRASSPTRVRMKVGVQNPPYGEVWVQTRAVGRETLRVTDEFELIEAPAAGTMAFAIQVAGPLAETLPLRVCVEDVWLSPVAVP